MNPGLLLLEDPSSSLLPRLLRTLGVHFESASSVEAALATCSARAEEKTALILPGVYLGQARALAHARSVSLAQLFSDFAAVLVCAWNGRAEEVEALGECIGGKIELSRLEDSEQNYQVKPLSAAEPFGGLEFGPVKSASDFGLTVTSSQYPVQTIVSIGALEFFTRVDLPTTQLFVCCSSAVFDVDAEALRNLRAAWRFSGLVPLLFFLRQCGITSWQTPVRTAHIVIDDPDLHSTYGFLEAKTLARCVDELQCAVSIAFIPWNFRRTSAEVVDLFRSRRPLLSLCIHGCDHIKAEFCDGRVSTSRQLIALALDRMERLSQSTGLDYDKVMVFPRGEFSASAMRALRESSLLAGVNTELVDNQTDRGVTAGQLLQPAITAYSGFPLFLRRSESEPLANFALDLLLGKPCLVRMHHDYFREGPGPFINLVNSLNSLDPSLTWTNLETIVSRTYSIRPDLDRGREVRLFSSYTRFPAQKLPAKISFSKREPLIGESFRASLDDREIPISRKGEELVFPGDLKPNGSTAVQIKMSAVPQTRLPSYPLQYRLKVATRRHLSRIRDNHDTGPLWMQALWRIVRKLNAKENSPYEEPS